MPVWFCNWISAVVELFFHKPIENRAIVPGMYNILDNFVLEYAQMVFEQSKHMVEDFKTYKCLYGIKLLSVHIDEDTLHNLQKSPCCQRNEPCSEHVLTTVLTYINYVKMSPSGSRFHCTLETHHPVLFFCYFVMWFIMCLQIFTRCLWISIFWKSQYSWKGKTIRRQSYFEITYLKWNWAS